MQHISIPKPMDAGNSSSYADKTGILVHQRQKKNRNLLAVQRVPEGYFTSRGHRLHNNML